MESIGDNVASLDRHFNELVAEKSQIVADSLKKIYVKNIKRSKVSRKNRKIIEYLFFSW